jgi:Zn-dependent protease with chaperone function
MSQYKRTVINQDNNITDRNPLRELAWLLTGLVVFVIVLYVVLGFVLEMTVRQLSPKQENWLWDVMSPGVLFEEVLDDPAALKKLERFERIVRSLPDDVLPGAYDVTLHLVDDSDVNAFAYPGGKIVMTSGFMDALKTENAMMFGIGHEIGHFANQDHLHGLGRSAAMVVISGLFLGQDSGVIQFLSGVLNLQELSHSRKAEEEADLWGLKILMAHYGHAGGYEDLFEALKHVEEDSIVKYLPEFLSSHPGTQGRMDRLRSVIEDNKYPVKPLKKL